MTDVFIIGGGPAAVSCALVLASAYRKEIASDKKITLVAHQKGSYLQDALLNNVYGIKPGTLGKDLLQQSLSHLQETYPHVEIIHDEKVTEVIRLNDKFQIKTNENIYWAKTVVVATNSTATFSIEGLNQYVIPHQNSNPAKNRIQLKNNNHLVDENIFVAGTLAGLPSQVSIAAGSGAFVATEILTQWNNGIPTHSHDSIKK
ncbi:MAG TPA: FAD-dependent oxidoreductase [Flavobacterium sp.]|nr:FAD-dependent oxidoreductase [Flavobacterium sp.]